MKNYKPSYTGNRQKEPVSYNDLIYQNKTKKIKRKIKGGWNPAVDNNTPICSACKHGNIKIVEILLNDPRVDPSVEDNFCLRLSLRNKYDAITKLLITNKKVRDNITSDIIDEFPELKIILRKYKLEELEGILEN